MATARFDVIGIGNAIVDVIAPADDAFLAEHGLAKGAMTLIDEARAQALYAKMAPGLETSGGSAATAASRSSPLSTAAAMSRPWACSIRVRPSLSRKMSSAMTTRTGSPWLPPWGRRAGC